MSNYQDSKVGAGIKVVSILSLIGNGFLFLGFLLTLVFKDSMGSIPGAESIKELSTNGLVISLILTILFIVSVSLILCKKVLGVYGYFGITIINIVYTAITKGFQVNSLLMLIFPALMALFISQKKELYGFGSKNNNLDA